MFSILLFSQLAHASATLNCAPVEGPALRYAEGGYTGGAAPGPDQVSVFVAWTLDDAPLYASSTTYGGDARVTGDLDWQWDLKSTKNQAGDALAQAYTATVTIWTRSGGPIGASLPQPRWSGTMRCVREAPLALP